MKSILILLAFGLAVGLYVLLRFAVKRMRALSVLKRFAKTHGYCLTKKDGCLLLEAGSAVYNIKLLGLWLKHCEIHFWSAEEYAVHWYVWRGDLVNTPPIGATNGGRRKQIGKWEISEGETPVLLLCPANAPVRLSQTRGTQLCRLHAGDKIGDVRFADLDYLVRFVEKEDTDCHGC